MFIPRSIAKRAPKSTAPVQTSNTLLPPSDSQPGPSNPKKRSVEPEESAYDMTDSDETTDEEDSSESESNKDSDRGEKQPGSTSIKDSKAANSTKDTAQQQTQSDIAARLELALSDISLWRTQALFQRLSETQDWYIPFSRLHDHPLLSPYLGDLSTRLPDAALVNAVRTYGSGAFESRMKIRTPSNAAWKGKTQSAWVGAAGGYEVRCKAWSERQEGWMDELTGMDEAAWGKRIVYIERVPIFIRSVWTLYHFTTALARESQSPDRLLESQLVQDVFIPIAEPTVVNRPPETMQKFRGQAFIVFSTPELAQMFARRWPWESTGGVGSGSDSSKNGKWNPEDAVAAATFSGFRSITKTRWDQLKSEYLAYQARVLKQNLKSEPHPARSATPSNNGQTIHHPTPAVASAPRHTRLPPFPPGILVFVRRIHPETNKTTLKTLLGRAFPSGSGDTIEYLDFQKGIDSAHIRLRTPSDASMIVEYFTSHFLAQHDGLDSEGQKAKKEEAIEMEVVSGVREMNYWEKVPEKIRMAAVARAGLGGDPGGGGEEKGRRKRQRKV